MIRVIGVYGKIDKLKNIVHSYELEISSNVVHFVSLKKITVYKDNVVPVIWVPETNNIEHGITDIYGNKLLFAFNNSGCISNPMVKKRLFQNIEKCANLGYKTIVLDALRYPSPHDNIGFLSCFCKHCLSREPKLRHIQRNLLSAIKTGNSRLFTDSLKELNEIRTRLVRELLVEIKEKAHELGLRIEAAVFLPILAKLVGQDYNILTKYIDTLQIMVYHKCNGAACLNHELASFTSLVARHFNNAEEILKELGIETLIEPEKLEKEGIPIDLLEKQLQEISRHSIPSLWFDEKFNKVIECVRKTRIDEIILFIP